LFLDLTIFVVNDHDDRWSNTAITPNEYSFCTAGTVRGVVTRYQKVLITGALHAKNPGFPALCAGSRAGRIVPVDWRDYSNGFRWPANLFDTLRISASSWPCNLALPV
jgi:hypothetical protein